MNAKADEIEDLIDQYSSAALQLAKQGDSNKGTWVGVFGDFAYALMEGTSGEEKL